MIWYLLYPFRGTTDPPNLVPTHPLRRAFTQHGRTAARHPVVTLLISVAIAAILVYPFPFLYTNDFTNGSSNLPHHVWTAAQPFEGKTDTLPDVVMRSVWVHGSYMKALEPHVLQAALEIQDDLLGSTVDFNPRSARDDFQIAEMMDHLTSEMRDSLHVINGLSNSSWFFHSPLLYWSCSSKSIQEDDDIIATVNERSRQATCINVTLRHSIVFSGKRFEDHGLVAADALVITLVHKIDSPVARQWERQAESLARKSSGKWRLYPKDGRVLTSQLYKFSFKPLSFHDDLILGIAYGLTLIYFLLSLTKLRALKSRFGLSVAVVTQIALSIMSSFTVCAVLNIDLSKIPREAYPLVVLTVGLENIFRLINAIIVTPSESSTAFRMGEALGETGHVALAGVAQNLFILWLLGKVVSSGVAAFCVFAAFALVFDFIYLLTFFVAVLSVEVRRTELSDSLNRRGQRPKSKVFDNAYTKQTWMDALLRGDVPVSTRVSGTVVMISFVLIAQWHFWDHENPMQTLSRLLRLGWMDQKPLSISPTQLSIDVNQARTPMAWLRLQDHETAREVIQIIKPNSHSYIARVYDPLIFLLDGSDRTPSQEGIRPFLPAVYDFVKNQSTSFIMTVFFIVAAVSLLMNYLLWDVEDANTSDDEDHFEDEPLMVVKSLNRGHALDIVLLAASPEGIIASVGLDRWIRIWDVRKDLKVHMVDTGSPHINMFPILAISIDDRGTWLAILSANGQVTLWSILDQQWGPSVRLDVKGQLPIIFSFVTSKLELQSSIILVRTSGIMTQITFSPDTPPEVTGLEICKTSLIFARLYLESSPATSMKPRVVATSRKGCLHIARQVQDNWFTENVIPLLLNESQPILSVVPLPQIYSLLAIRQDTADLVESGTHRIVHTFTLPTSQPNSVRCLYSIHRTPQCGSKSLAFFCLVYNEQDSGDCVLRTYFPRQENEVLCTDHRKCRQDQLYCSWENAVVQEYRMESPGKWETLPTGVVVGVRRRRTPAPVSNGFGHSSFTVPTSGLRRRAALPTQLEKLSTIEDDDIWETWMLSAKGERHSITLAASDSRNLSDGHLLVSSCGPMVRVGQRSVAVGLGNVIKVITVGHERFTVDCSYDDTALAMASRRRKPVGKRKSSTGSH